MRLTVVDFPPANPTLELTAVGVVRGIELPFDLMKPLVISNFISDAAEVIDISVVLNVLKYFL